MFRASSRVTSQPFAPAPVLLPLLLLVPVVPLIQVPFSCA